MPSPLKSMPPETEKPSGGIALLSWSTMRSGVIGPALTTVGLTLPAPSTERIAT